MRHGLILIALALSAGSALATDLTREQTISAQLVRPGLQGEPRWLKAGEEAFLALLLKSDAEQRLGGAILLHEAGDHADWPEVIGPLRRDLARRGWDSLSLQLPRPLNPLSESDRQAAIEQAAGRIQAAFRLFADQQTNDLVLLGHGLGAEMALAFVADSATEQVRGLVAIGLAAGDGGDDDPVLQTIARLQRPMLDLYGEREAPRVLANAQIRRATAKRNQQENYRQDRVAGADHHFKGLQPSLLRRVGSWLRRVAREPPKQTP
jgi:pimeloyl-ACP methyl ester carboxylesterase